MFALAETSVESAKDLRPGDIMTEFGEVVEIDMLDEDLVDVLFHDGFSLGRIVFHAYEDVEISIL